MIARRRQLISGLCILTGAAVLTGCSPTKSRYEAIKRNPTPELRTLYQREADQNNALTRTFDENLRMFSEDLGRAVYIDRPSRLTREPIPVP